MTLRPIFKPLSRVRPRTDDENMVSIVLLLREPEILLQREYAAAMERSWGASDQNHIAVQGPLAILRSDANLVHAVRAGRPYWASEKVIPGWAHHAAFATVDHMSPKLEPDARYAVIARLVLALLTENCVAAFSPALGGLVRNEASLTERLRAMAGSCKAGR